MGRAQKLRVQDGITHVKLQRKKTRRGIIYKPVPVVNTPSTAGPSNVKPKSPNKTGSNSAARPTPTQTCRENGSPFKRQRLQDNSPPPSLGFRGLFNDDDMILGNDMVLGDDVEEEIARPVPPVFKKPDTSGNVS